MASIDQAFIKAYARDDAKPATGAVDVRPEKTSNIPAPHVRLNNLSVAPAATGAGTVPLTQWLSAQSATAPLPASTHAPEQHQQSPPSNWRLDRGHPLLSTTTAAPAALPLSAFAPKVAVPVLRPAFEVDRFVWPSSVEKLLKVAGDGFSQLAQTICEQVRNEGPLVIGVTGMRRGIGQSSLLLALARRLAAEKATTAIVDADFQAAQLARQMGLAVRIGFDDVLAGELQLSDVLVESLEDGIALLPLKERIFDGIELRDKYRLPGSLGSLADHYEVTLVDAGPLTNLDRPRVHCLAANCGLSSLILIRDLRRDTDQDLDQAEATLAAAGIPCFGIVENFGT